MLTRRTAIRLFSHAALALTIGATIPSPLPAAEVKPKPRMVRLRHNWSHIPADQDTYTWIPENTLPFRPWHHEWRVDEEMTHTSVEVV